MRVANQPRMSESTTLSEDDVLVKRAEDLVAVGNEATADLLPVLLQVEERNVYARRRFASMHDFCVKHLGLSKGSAYRRTNAARLVRDLPALSGLIRSGAVTLSALVALRDHLTPGNLEELITATQGMSKREIREHLRSGARERQPRGGPATVRKLPTLQTGTTITSVVDAGGPQPVDETRYRFGMTMSQGVLKKLERARELAKRAKRTPDLNAVFEQAMDALIEKLEKELGEGDADVLPTAEVVEGAGAASTLEPASGVSADVPETAEPPARPGIRRSQPPTELARLAGEPRQVHGSAKARRRAAGVRKGKPPGGVIGQEANGRVAGRSSAR